MSACAVSYNPTPIRWRTYQKRGKRKVSECVCTGWEGERARGWEGERARGWEGETERARGREGEEKMPLPDHVERGCVHPRHQRALRLSRALSLPSRHTASCAGRGAVRVAQGASERCLLGTALSFEVQPPCRCMSRCVLLRRRATRSQACMCPPRSRSQRHSTAGRAT